MGNLFEFIGISVKGDNIHIRKCEDVRLAVGCQTIVKLNYPAFFKFPIRLLSGGLE